MRRTVEFIGAGVASLAVIAGGAACKTGESRNQGISCDKAPFQTMQVTHEYSLLNRSCDQGLNAVTLYEQGSDGNIVDENETIFIPKDQPTGADYIIEYNHLKAVAILYERGNIVSAAEGTILSTPTPTFE